MPPPSVSFPRFHTTGVHGVHHARFLDAARAALRRVFSIFICYTTLAPKSHSLVDMSNDLALFCIEYACRYRLGTRNRNMYVAN